jgi:hypothetical protein
MLYLFRGPSSGWAAFGFVGGHNGLDVRIDHPATIAVGDFRFHSAKPGQLLRPRSA